MPLFALLPRSNAQKQSITVIGVVATVYDSSYELPCPICCETLRDQPLENLQTDNNESYKVIAQSGRILLYVHCLVSGFCVTRMVQNGEWKLLLAGSEMHRALWQQQLKKICVLSTVFIIFYFFLKSSTYTQIGLRRNPTLRFIFADHVSVEDSVPVLSDMLSLSTVDTCYAQKHIKSRQLKAFCEALLL